MKAAVLYGKEDVKIEKVPIPRVGSHERVFRRGVVIEFGQHIIPRSIVPLNEGVPCGVPQ